jgi:hypothetical protein
VLLLLLALLLLRCCRMVQLLQLWSSHVSWAQGGGTGVACDGASLAHSCLNRPEPVTIAAYHDTRTPPALHDTHHAAAAAAPAAAAPPPAAVAAAAPPSSSEAPPRRTLYRAPSNPNLTGSSNSLPRVPSNSNLEVLDVRGVMGHPWHDVQGERR